MKLNFVVQAYGPEVVGGAEWACRQLATGMAARGHEVTVLSTCARESATWANALPPGDATDGQVRVIRFPNIAPRDPELVAFSERFFQTPNPSIAQQRRWIEMQGPNCPALIEQIAARSHEPDLWIFYTYLYYPTVVGLPIVGDRALLHPALHDELPAYLPIIRDAIRSASALSMQTPEEWALTIRLMGWALWKVKEVGMGVSEGTGDGPAFRQAFGLGDDPFLLYLGRVDRGKGSEILASHFARYKEERPSGLKLVVAGHVFDQPPSHPDIVVTGSVSEDQKWAGLQECEIFMQPSYYESFGISLLEAWLKKKPAIVNAECSVTAGHAARAQGALSFSNYTEFAGALEVLTSDKQARRLLGENGWTYAQRYLWGEVLDRYENFIGSVAGSPKKT